MRKFAIAALLLTCAFDLSAQRRKSKKDIDPPTQVLPPAPEPPDAVVVETARLSFQVSPLSTKGLLSQQVRDALNALRKESRGATIVKLRAFVAGSGDLRRVAAIVGEAFTEDKLTVPAVSTVQVGALPLIGAQVLIEAVSSERRPVNPNGLAFLSATMSEGPTAAAANIKQRAAGMDVVRLTCFLSSLEDMTALRNEVSSAFPMAASAFVQLQRLGIERQMGCEATARLQTPRAAAPDVAVITAPKIVLTSTKLVFRDQESDIRLTFQRLGRSIEPFGASLKDTLWAGVFGLTRPISAQVNSIQTEFFGKPVPGGTLIVEGLPSTDATAAVELIAAVH